jgi:hypothetical protein
MPTRAKPPACPTCGEQVALVRTIEKNDADRVLNVFECRRCRLSYTVAEQEDEKRRDS